MQFPILIGLRRSRILDAAVLMVAILASISSLRFPSTSLVQSALLLSIWSLAIWAWHRLKPGTKTLRLERNGAISLLRSGDSEYISVKLEPNAIVHPWLTVVRLNTEEAYYPSWIVTVDSLKDADFRHLRMFLRWQAKFSGSGDDV